MRAQGQRACASKDSAARLKAAALTGPLEVLGERRPVVPEPAQSDAVLAA